MTVFGLDACKGFRAKRLKHGQTLHTDESAFFLGFLTLIAESSNAHNTMQHIKYK